MVFWPQAGAGEGLVAAVLRPIGILPVGFVPTRGGNGLHVVKAAVELPGIYPFELFQSSGQGLRLVDGIPSEFTAAAEKKVWFFSVPVDKVTELV